MTEPARAAGGLSARRLVQADERARQRRLATLPGPTRLLAQERVLVPLAGIATGVALAAIAARAGVAEARGWWLATTIGAAALVVMRGPWRLFWRPDATLLGRLPIRGRALYGLSTWRAARTSAGWLIALALAAAPIAGGAAAWARHALVAALALAPAALVAPAVTALAGAVVASRRSERLIRELADAPPPPPVVWLSLLPAGAGALLAWWGVHLAARTAGRGPADAAVAGAAGLAAAAALHLVVGRLVAPGLGEATRFVAALDAVKLAHVDLVGPRPLERAWARITGAARSIYLKDVTLLRRRYPAYYLLTGLAIGGMWLCAALGGPARLRAAVVLAAGVAAYVLLVARRLASPPTERPRLLATLPVPRATAARAKRAYVAWRAIWPLAVGGIPVVVRAGGDAALAGALVALAAVATVAGALLVRPHAPE